MQKSRNSTVNPLKYVLVLLCGRPLFYGIYLPGIILCMRPINQGPCNAFSHWLGAHTEWSLIYLSCMQVFGVKMRGLAQDHGFSIADVLETPQAFANRGYRGLIFCTKLDMSLLLQGLWKLSKYWQQCSTSGSVIDSKVTLLCSSESCVAW